MKKAIVVIAMLVAITSSGCVSIQTKNKRLDIGATKDSEVQMLYNSLKEEGKLVSQEYSGNYDETGSYHSHRVAFYKTSDGTIFRVVLSGWDHPISINTVKGGDI